MSFKRARLLQFSLAVGWTACFPALSLSEDMVPTSNDAPVTLEPIEILGSRIERNPAGRTIGKLERDKIESMDAFSLKDLMTTLPGITLKQSNGPRDVGISMRGSGAKQTFGVRNIKVYEDWFPTTQSDGLSRTDLHDPNAYEGVDTIRGPSSSLYDNYAIGGVINFRSRKGRDIGGLDIGSSGGTHNYFNNYLHWGNKHERFEFAFFGSFIRSDGYIRHSSFRTATQNLTLFFAPDEKRTFTFKYLNNDLRADVPSRLTLDQYDADPAFEGLTAITGDGNVTATQAAQNREDRRTIVGGRYEHALTPQTGFRFMGAYDVKDINQTFGTIGDNINPNFHQYADITHENTVLGMPAKHLAGVFFNYMEAEATSFRNLADFKGTRGALQSNTRGYHRNMGGRLREEIDLSPRWKTVAGIGLETSQIKADVQTRTAAETYARVSASRDFLNWAPETSVIFAPAPDYNIRARAGMAYGIPGIGQLTTTPAGIAGNNTGLNPQKVLGFELGSGGKVAGMFNYDISGYYEFFYDEFVTQSPGSGLSSFTSNAPRSDHRGAEAALEIHPWRGSYGSATYTFNDHVYREFSERIGTGPAVDRAGKQVPGVERHLINSRVGYEVKNLMGGWIEVNRVEPFFINNSNTLEVPASTVWNGNLHVTRKFDRCWFKAFTVFLDVKNIFDQKYIASSNVVADLPTDTPASLRSGKQAFFAGQDLSFITGLKLSF